jgi:hypothetical protein
METNAFNICPTCNHKESCVLTTQKNQVWSCSDYDEIIAKKNSNVNYKRDSENYLEKIMF